MKIVDERKELKSEKFCNLGISDVFESNGYIYIKISHSGCDINAFNLEAFAIINIEPTKSVHPLDAELVIRGYKNE